MVGTGSSAWGSGGTPGGGVLTDTKTIAQQNIAVPGNDVLASTTTVPDAIASADQGITETAELVQGSATPDSATNNGRVAASAVVHKITNAGTCTVRVKRDGTTIGSTTSASIALNTTAKVIVMQALTNETAVAHTYGATIQFNITGGRYIFLGITGVIVSLTGSCSCSACTCT